MGPDLKRVLENDDLFYELIRPVLPDATAVEARHGTDDPVQRPELRMQAVMAFRLRRLDKRSKRLVDEHCDAFVAHVRDLAAAGAVECIASILTMRDGVIPPTINLTEPDPDLDLDYVPNQAREMQVDAIANNSFGFGGHNACLVAKKFR